ncbi:polysaccharide deacetylase family protein [Marinobacter sp.]|uniref:polysaccharide deacetylase family protein n=1 Tax=Marinobacter sp. TaxID=50741 RepID=UPI0034A11901
MVTPTARYVFVLLMAGLSLGARADLVVLQYHHVSDSTPPATSTSVSLFEGQLGAIAGENLDVVALQTGAEEALDGALDDRKQVAITFDDAYDSVYQTAAPMLDRFGFPYTIFVNTDAVGNRGYMTWDQLRELNEHSNVTIANHSHEHGHLAKRSDESESDWEARVDKSLDRAQALLKEELDIDVPMFAYPYGEFDSALERKLAQRGWIGFGQQSGAVGATSGRTRLPRFPMANAYGQLGSLNDKLLSKALPVEASTLPAGILTENPPTLEFRLPDPLSASRLSCFASGQGRVELETAEDGLIRVRAPNAFNSRRFRYNCTHPTNDGRYYWFSQQWLDLDKPED